MRPWDKRRKEFFDSNPTCKVCDNKLDHLSRTMVCRSCQREREKERGKGEQGVYMKRYYEEHREEIRKKRKVHYKNSRW